MITCILNSWLDIETEKNFSVSKYIRIMNSHISILKLKNVNDIWNKHDSMRFVVILKSLIVGCQDI